MRNNFSLGLPAPKSNKNTRIRIYAIEKIEEHEGEQYNLSLLEDIKIGYKMTMNAKTISLEPSWFYLYRDEWKSIKVNAIGGEQVGLE